MKLTEVSRPSDFAAEKAKEQDKIEAMKAKIAKAYTSALTAPKLFIPHQSDVSHWLFGGGPADTSAMKELIVWTDAVGYMVGVNPSDDEATGDKRAFRVLSHHLGISEEMIEFVINYEG